MGDASGSENMSGLTPEALLGQFLSGIEGYTDTDPDALEAEPLIGGLGAMSVKLPSALREAELIIARFITPPRSILGTIGWRTSEHKRLKAVAETSIEVISKVRRQVRALRPTSAREVISEHANLSRISEDLDTMLVCLRSPKKTNSDIFRSLQSFIRATTDEPYPPLDPISATPLPEGFSDDGIRFPFSNDEQDEMCDIERTMLLQSGVARQSTYPIHIFSRWSSLTRSSSTPSSFSSIHFSLGTMYSVHLFRERSPIHHEYAVFSFCRRSGTPPDSWVRVERAARLNARLDAPRPDSIGPIIGGADLRESISFSTTKDGLRRSPDDELASVVFDIKTKNVGGTPSSTTQNMLLDKLARQLHETSAASNRYRLLTENCRWFARRNMLSIVEHVGAAGFVYHPTWLGKPCTGDRLRRKLGDETFGGRQLGGAKAAHITAKSLLDLAGASIIQKEFDDALLHCRKALGILEGIPASSTHARYLHSLALNYLGISLNNLGRSLAALDAQKHACRISSEFSSEHEDLFFSTHNSLAATLTALGRRDEAAEIRRSLVDFRRRVHETQQDTFSAARLALLLLNYTIALADLPDRGDDRIKAIQDAVDLYRNLVDQRPDLYQGDLGVALSEYAHVMDGAGRAQEAYDLSLEGISIMRSVFALHPEDCLEDLALHISNHAAYAAKAELWRDACDAGHEAVSLYRRLYSTRNPYNWRASLAGALSNLGQHLRCAGRPFDAVDVWQEAFGLYRILHAREPEKYRDHVSNCLQEIADIVRTTPKWGECDPSPEGTP